MPVSGPTYKQVTGSPTSGGPSVTGTTVSTDSAVVLWDGVGGSDLKNSGVIIDGSNNVSGISSLNTSGRVGFGGASSTSYLLNLGATNPLSGTTQGGISCQYTATSTATTIYGIVSFQDTPNSGSPYTVSYRRAIYAGFGVKGTNCTIGRDVAYAVTGTPQGTQSAILCDNPTNFTGTWAIYLESTNPSYFAGKIGIGDAPSANYILRAGNTEAQNPLTGTVQIGAGSEMVGTAAATTAVVGLSANVTSAASAITLTYLAQIQAANRTKGTGSTILNKIGVLSYPQTGGTANANFSDTDALTAGSWGLHLLSTNGNILAGQTAIGGTAISSAQILRVGGVNTLTGTSQYGVA